MNVTFWSRLSGSDSGTNGSTLHCTHTITCSFSWQLWGGEGAFLRDKREGELDLELVSISVTTNADVPCVAQEESVFQGFSMIKSMIFRTVNR